MADGAAPVSRSIGDGEQLRHAFAARFHQGFEGAGMFVGHASVGILIAEDAAIAGGKGGGGAVADRGGATPDSDIPMRRWLRQRQSRNRHQY